MPIAGPGAGLAAQDPVSAPGDRAAGTRPRAAGSAPVAGVRRRSIGRLEGATFAYRDGRDDPGFALGPAGLDPPTRRDRHPGRGQRQRQDDPGEAALGPLPAGGGRRPGRRPRRRRRGVASATASSSRSSSPMAISSRTSSGSPAMRSTNGPARGSNALVWRTRSRSATASFSTTRPLAGAAAPAGVARRLARGPADSSSSTNGPPIRTRPSSSSSMTSCSPI